MKNLLQKVLVISLLVLLSGWYVTAQCPIVPPLTENFSSNSSPYFTPSVATTTSDAYYATQALILTGGDASGWTGGTLSTTAANAWVNNTAHHASAITCNVDATSMSHPELKIDLKQTYSYSPLFSWFRVLINGTTQIGPDYNPVTQESDNYQTLTFDLEAYAGQIFTITLQSSCKYSDSYVVGFGDAAFIDNVIIQEQPSTYMDVGVLSIDLPETGCNLGSTEHVQVTVKNLGTVTTTSFDLKYSIDGGPVRTTLIYAPIIPGAELTCNFTVDEDFTAHKAYSINAWTVLAGDAFPLNDAATATIYSYGMVSSFPYYEDFNSGNGSWLSGGANSSWQYGVPPYAYLPAYKSATDAFYKTNLNGWYNNSELSWVESPCFDLSAFTSPNIGFDKFMDMEPVYDKVKFEYSINGGLTWNTYATYYGSSVWGSMNYNIAAIAGQSNVKFRFLFNSDAYNNAYNGFAFDNFTISQYYAIGELSVSLASTIGCNLTVLPVTINVANIGSANVSGTFNAIYTVDGGTPVSQTKTVNLNPGQNIDFILSAGVPISSGPHTVVTSIDWLDNNAGNNTVTTQFTTVATISSFPFTENFTSTPNNLGFANNYNATISLVGGAVKMTGIDGSTWIGGSSPSPNGTTYAEAWGANSSHFAVLWSCIVDATSLSSLELLFDLKQEFVNGPGYSWFHVVANNGSNVYVLSDVNGKSEFQPSVYGTPEWARLRFDLSSFAGQSISLDLYASNAYAGNIAWVDNLLLRSKLSKDASLERIIAPVSGCDLTATDKVTVQVKNWGITPISNFYVYYQKNYPAGTTYSKFYGSPAINPGATANIQFANTENFIGSTITAWVALPLDSDTGNDTYTSGIVTSLYDNLSTTYFTSLETEVTSTGGWAVQDGNLDGTSWIWDSGSPKTGLSAYGFPFHFATGNDWLFTKCFNLDAGQTYEINFWYSTSPEWATSKTLKVYYGMGQSIASMTSSLSGLNLTDIVTLDTYTYAMDKFAPLVTGTYYFGFKATGNQTIDAQYVLIDDITIRKVLPSDLEITALLSPVDACDGYHSGNEQVKITLKNNSGDMISMGTPVNVSYSVDGGPAFTETIILTSDFYPGNTIDHIFTTSTVDMIAADAYSFNVWVSYPYELNTGNDLHNIVINTWALPEFTIDGLASGYCIGTISDLLSVNPSTYSTGYYTLSPATAGMLVDNYDGTANFAPLVASLNPYYVTYHYTDNNFCYNTYSETTYVTDLSAFSMTPDVPTYNLLYPAEIELDAGPDFQEYLWSTTAATQSITINDIGLYAVTVTLNNCSATDEILITNTENHDIPLKAGWGIFSTYLDITTDIETIMTNDPDVAYLNPPAKNLIIVKDDMGQVFWWDVPAPLTPVNNIHNLVVGNGYQYKMHAPAVLNLTGSAVKPQLTPLTLDAGHHIIGYLKRIASDIECELSGIEPSVLLAVDEEGLVWWPDYDIDYINILQPGKGYKLFITAATTLIYHAYTNPCPIDKYEIINNAQHYTNLNKTENNMVLGIPQEAWSLYPENGDEIGVFKGDLLVGSCIYNGDNVAVTIWGDDALTTETEGMRPNETYTLNLWHQATNTEEILNVVSWAAGNEYFNNNTVSVVGKLETSGFESNKCVLFQNMPNPFSEKTEISFFLPADTHVELCIYNIYGEIVSTVVSDDMKSGLHKFILTDDLASGNYYYKMITNDYVGIKSMTVTR